MPANDGSLSIANIPLQLKKKKLVIGTPTLSQVVFPPSNAISPVLRPGTHIVPLPFTLHNHFYHRLFVIAEISNPKSKHLCSTTNRHWKRKYENNFNKIWKSLTFCSGSHSQLNGPDALDEGIMSNQAHIDYDKQFQDDLAKATALSLEQHALDDYRRNKKYGSGYQQSSTVAGRDYQAAQRSQSLHQPRRHSEVHQVAITPENAERSRTPPAQGTDNDLICFASPTSKQPESSSPFGKLIEDLQRMQPTNPQSALVPMGPVASASIPPQYGFPPHQQRPTAAQPTPYGMVAGGVVGGPAYGDLQLVPYQPAAQQQRPLNSEELQRLYSMPAQMAVVPVPQPNAYMYYPGAVVTPYTAPIVPGSAAFMPPQYPAQGYGFGGAYTHMDLRRPQSQPAPQQTAPTTSHHHSQPSNHSTSSPAEANGVAFPARRQVPSTVGVSSSSHTGNNGHSSVPRRGNDLIDLNHED